MDAIIERVIKVLEKSDVCLYVDLGDIRDLLKTEFVGDYIHHWTSDDIHDHVIRSLNEDEFRLLLDYLYKNKIPYTFGGYDLDINPRFYKKVFDLVDSKVNAEYGVNWNVIEECVKGLINNG